MLHQQIGDECEPRSGNRTYTGQTPTKKFGGRTWKDGQTCASVRSLSRGTPWGRVLTMRSWRSGHNVSHRLSEPKPPAKPNTDDLTADSR
jgi:hypothetical protein